MSYYFTPPSLNSLLITLFLLANLSCNQNINNKNIIDYDKVNLTVYQETFESIRPGIPGKIPFWNRYAQQYIYAPAFEVLPLTTAEKYLFTALGSDSIEYTFIAEKTYEDLSPIWNEIPVGFVQLKISGIDLQGNEVGEKKLFSFYKAASFRGPYHQKTSDYEVSAEKALEYEFNQNHIQNWAINGNPDIVAYNLYCYPSKNIGAVTEIMLEYSKISKQDHDQALQIAINAAEYLINISEPKGAPLEFFPPTYAGEQRTSKAYSNQFMTIYPAHTASTYLDLFDVTQDIKYKEAALRIAATYKKLQEPSGTWKLKLWRDGSPVTNNECIPVGIIRFLDRLESQYNIKEYMEVKNNAFDWIFNNPLKTYNWSGQFEDIAPVEPYKNLSKDEASGFAIYLFERVDENENFIQIADELLRFCEDQFIIWEKPMPQKQYNVEEWITPCVLEQYSCYEPINASVANMMEAYLAGYKATKNEVYKAKAIELANAVTLAQHPDTGRYPTYWQLNERQNTNIGWIDWLNCTSYCAKIMLKVADFTKNND